MQSIIRAAIRRGARLIYTDGVGAGRLEKPNIPHTPPPSHQHQLSRTNYAVAFHGGDAAHGPAGTGVRMLWPCQPVASPRPKGGPRGSLEPGAGGERGKQEAELAGTGRRGCCCCCWSRSNCTAASPRSFPFISPLLAPAKQPQFVCSVSPPPALPPSPSRSS